MTAPKGASGPDSGVKVTYVATRCLQGLTGMKDNDLAVQADTTTLFVYNTAAGGWVGVEPTPAGLDSIREVMDAMGFRSGAHEIWDPAQTYPEGVAVRWRGNQMDPDMALYISLKNGNLNHDPESDAPHTGLEVRNVVASGSLLHPEPIPRAAPDPRGRRRGQDDRRDRRAEARRGAGTCGRRWGERP